MGGRACAIGISAAVPCGTQIESWQTLCTVCESWRKRSFGLLPCSIVVGGGKLRELGGPLPATSFILVAEPSRHVRACRWWGWRGQYPQSTGILVPTFDLGIDNVEIWTNKVELLLTAWPCNRVQELATRLVLGCKGTEFQKLQLHRSEMIINDPKGIQRIVELVGGKWGAVPLEKKFELVEKALYRGQQRADETSDSYLSRCDVIWIELISKKIDLKEIQAYILLRGSRLGSDDKKRVIVDSGAEKGGEFEVAKVEAAVCMIGSGFFQDMVGAKRDKRLKTYDRLSVLKNEVNTMRASLKPCGLKRNISMTALSRHGSRRRWGCRLGVAVCRCCGRDRSEWSRAQRFLHFVSGGAKAPLRKGAILWNVVRRELERKARVRAKEKDPLPIELQIRIVGP